MVEFNGNNITLTRGDTVFLDTVILTPTGLVYEPKENDVLTFAVYKETYGEGFENKPIIKKTFENRKIKLAMKDTAYLKKGEYLYKCVIEMAENEIKETYLEGKFILK